MQTYNTPLADQAGTFIDAAAETADHAIRSSQRVANQSLSQMAGRIDDVRAQANSAIGRLGAEAGDMKRRGVAAVRDSSHRLSLQAHRATDSTRGYSQEKPVKAVLLAAALGVGLMALLSLVSRSSATRD